MKTVAILGLALTLTPIATWASGNADIVVDRLVLAAATTNTRPTALFFTLTNTGKTDRTLVSVETPACGRTELHDHILDGDVMKMRQVDGITVPAGTTVALKPMGLHVMCFDPVLPQTVGQTVDVTLNFAGGTSQTHPADIQDIATVMRATGPLTH